MTVLLVTVALLVYLAITMRADYPGCDMSRCDGCPFPCEKHTESEKEK